MDPNETLRRIHEFLTRGDSGEAVDHWAEDLAVWVEDLKSFAPDWERYPLGASYYRTRLVGRESRGNLSA